MPIVLYWNGPHLVLSFGLAVLDSAHYPESFFNYRECDKLTDK